MCVNICYLFGALLATAVNGLTVGAGVVEVAAALATAVNGFAGLPL
jgi:hypothetical protein